MDRELEAAKAALVFANYMAKYHEKRAQRLGRINARNERRIGNLRRKLARKHRVLKELRDVIKFLVRYADVRPSWVPERMRPWVYGYLSE